MTTCRTCNGSGTVTVVGGIGLLPRERPCSCKEGQTSHPSKPNLAARNMALTGELEDLRSHLRECERANEKLATAVRDVWEAWETGDEEAIFGAIDESLSEAVAYYWPEGF